METQLTTVSKNYQKKEKQQPDFSGMYGYVPPQSKDLEEAVLGAILIEKGAFYIANEILKPDCFYSDANQRVYGAMVNLALKNMPIDLLTVVNQLKTNEGLDAVGGPYYVSKLTNAVVSSANILTHCRIVLQKYILRELIKVNGEIMSACYNDTTDAFEILDEAESKIFNISISNLSNDYTDLQTGMIKVIKKIEGQQQVSEDITGVPSGCATLDGITHGWQPENLIVIAARPSVGKSAFALNLARYAATDPAKPCNVGFFSLEMSTSQLIQRVLSAQSEIWLDRIKTGKMEQWHMEKLINKGMIILGATKMFIDDTAGLSIPQFRSKARRMVMKDKVKLIIIDYLQLMKTGTKTGNREQEISYISRELKIVAKELKIPIIALAQLSREVEKRAIKVPVLADLRESGAIEQDADIVGFLYRPSKEERADDAELRTKAMFDIAKNRDGALIDLAFEVDDSIQKWTEIGEMGASAKSNFQRVPTNYHEPKEKDDAPF